MLKSNEKYFNEKYLPVTLKQYKHKQICLWGFKLHFCPVGWAEAVEYTMCFSAKG